VLSRAHKRDTNATSLQVNSNAFKSNLDFYSGLIANNRSTTESQHVKNKIVRQKIDEREMLLVEIDSFYTSLLYLCSTCCRRFTALHNEQIQTSKKLLLELFANTTTTTISTATIPDLLLII